MSERESDVEKRHRKRVAAQGGRSYKFVSPGRRNVPDRLDLFGVFAAARVYTDEKYGKHVQISSPDMALARRMLEAALCFTELKAPGKKPRPGQVREIKRLREMGFAVRVVDS